MASQDRFGYQWGIYNAVEPQHETQFLNWAHPITAPDFKDRSVLDAGCGMGRNSYWPLTYGASRVVAFDFDETSLAMARENLKAYPNAEVVFADIHKITYEDEFDFVISNGVVHHLEDPQLALTNLVRALKPGGTLLVWLYSYEGNEWIVRYVDPVRKNFTSKLPLPFVHFISYACTIPLWLYLKLTGGHTPYLQQLSKYSLHAIHNIVFDQLIPTIAHYWTREQITEIASALKLASFTVEAPPNKQGWILKGLK